MGMRNEQFSELTWEQKWNCGLAALVANAPLRPETQQNLMRAARAAYADIAIAEFVRLIDSLRNRSRWSIACELAQRLREFEARGRQPTDRVERALNAVLRSSPP